VSLPQGELVTPSIEGGGDDVRTYDGLVDVAPDLANLDREGHPAYGGLTSVALSPPNPRPYGSDDGANRLYWEGFGLGEAIAEFVASLSDEVINMLVELENEGLDPHTAGFIESVYETSVNEQAARQGRVVCWSPRT
jgi:hypothetical protein